MGWLFPHHTFTVGQLHKEILDDLRREPGYTVLKTAKTQFGRRLWVAVETEKHGAFIILFYCAKQGGTWGYKSVDETSHPSALDCPLGLLDLTEGRLRDQNNYSRDWRARVRHVATQWKTLPLGTLIDMPGASHSPYAYVGLQGRRPCGRGTDGKIYALPKDLEVGGPARTA